MRFGSRSRAAGIAAGLFVLAQTTAFAQNFQVRPQAVVVTKTDTYLPGPVQMVAAANADKVNLHPQGRYALVTQEEATLPPASLMGQSQTGAAALLLYDARLHKTRVIWQRRADGGKHLILSMEWLPQTDCALVTAYDKTPPTADANNAVVAGGEINGSENVTLLLFDFEKSLAPRVLATSPKGIEVSVSPTKPIFVVREGDKLRMGSAPRGAFGPTLTVQLPSGSILGYPGDWSADGTQVYGTEFIKTLPPPETGPKFTRKPYLWNGTGDVMLLDAAPKKAMLAQTPPPPVLPVVLRFSTLSVPTPTPLTPPPSKTPNTATERASTPPPATVLHPVYLEAVEPFPSAANSYRSALVSPDAEKSYLLADHAVLYESGGALYAVPLVKLNSAQYAQVQKAQAIQNAKQVGLGILMYTQDYDEAFPLQSRFADGINPYLKNDAAVQSFTYLGPNGGPLSSVASPAITIMGYIAAPGGRAVVYVDGHVKWEDEL